MNQSAEKIEVSQGDLIVVEKLNLPEVFTEDGVEKLLNKLKKEVGSIVPDLETKKGRDYIASLAYRISQCKKPLEEAGKSLVAEKKAEVKLVDSSRINLIKRIDEFKIEVRKPLTEWENTEKKKEEDRIAKEADRMDYIQDIITAIGDASNYLDGKTSDELEEINALLVGLKIDSSFDEFEAMAALALETSMERVGVAYDTRKAFEEEQVRMEEQRIEQEQKEAALKEQQDKLDAQQKEIDLQKAAEQKVKDDAALKERLEKEAKIKAERELQEQKDKEEKDRLEEERIAEEKIKQEAIDLAKKEEDEKLKAEQAPDKEKLIVFFDKLNKSDSPIHLKTAKAKRTLKSFEELFEELLQEFEVNINKL